MTTRLLLLAGSSGMERVPQRPDPEDARWFEPLHVRDERGARGRIAAQVAAGADVVVAPTWLTHRRALLPLGETRQARAWTAAAIGVARDGVEVGLELRVERLANGTERAASELWRSRPVPLVAASLPSLDEAPEPGEGRLLPREAASARDYRDQAGLLADAGPDLLLVEGQRSRSELRVASDEAMSTGLPSWVALAGPLTPADPEDDLAEWRASAGTGRLLLPLPVAAATGAIEHAGEGWGGLVGSGASAADDAARWLEAGATVIGLLDAAAPERLERLRTTIDTQERAELEAHERMSLRWHHHVARGVSMAPGGPALWLGSAPTAPLPSGFDWLVVDDDELPRLPRNRYRLIIDPAGTGERAATLGALLELGGIIALRVSGTLQGAAQLRLLWLDEELDPPLAILRREA